MSYTGGIGAKITDRVDEAATCSVIYRPGVCSSSGETRRKKPLYVGLYLYSKLDTDSGIGRVCEDRRNRR